LNLLLLNPLRFQLSLASQQVGFAPKGEANLRLRMEAETGGEITHNTATISSDTVQGQKISFMHKARILARSDRP
jgi:hypothetical protein